MGTVRGGRSWRDLHNLLHGKGRRRLGEDGRVIYRVDHVSHAERLHAR